MFKTLRAYLEEHLTAITDANYHTAASAFVAWVEGKESEAQAETDKIKAEVEHLTAAGYIVSKAPIAGGTGEE